MRTCCACGETFEATGKGYRCPPCRRSYDRDWRARRKASGNPVRTPIMPREYHRDYERRYFEDVANRERRNKLMRGYANAPRTKERHAARALVRKAIRQGNLTKQPCEVCGASQTHAHHDDYSRALSVRWLCPQHHHEHHAKAEGRS